MIKMNISPHEGVSGNKTSIEFAIGRNKNQELGINKTNIAEIIASTITGNPVSIYLLKDNNYVVNECPLSKGAVLSGPFHDEESGRDYLVIKEGGEDRRIYYFGEKQRKHLGSNVDTYC